MAKAREIPGLSADEPYAVAAARIVSVRADELVDNSERVLDIADIERVHDMRVASRRLRAALEIFEPCFPKKPFKAALKEVKQIADALGERRDRDVSIAALEGFAASMPAPDRPGVQSLVAGLRNDQRAANEALVHHVAQERLRALRARLAELAEQAEASASQSRDGHPA